MEDDGKDLIYLGAGPIAAVLLGMALVPVRDFTTASNFTFLFLALTIVVGEFGGRTAAVATAVASALSLDFFLTQPYMRLTIAEKHDLLAFFGLAACGLLTASLASGRGRWAAPRAPGRKQLELVHSSVAELEQGGPLEPRLVRTLDACRLSLPVAAAVVRDRANGVLATSGPGPARPVPGQALELDTLLPPGRARESLPRRGLPLPAEGGRLSLVAGKRHCGWLDVWGSGAPATTDARRSLSDVARVIAALLAEAERGR
ncbi:MAG TPA: DUF4118 domain-containing protein [Vicinamibacteria bacterium]|nr:DUF4118 domain-containing protein [Vicinamibacteria bacterium]